MLWFKTVAVLFIISSVENSCKMSSSTCLYAEDLLNGNNSKVLMPTLGNGYIGTVVLSDTVHVAGLYNGKANVQPAQYFRSNTSSNVEHTHRARIPSTVAVNFSLHVEGKRSFALNVEEGVFYQWFKNNKSVIEQRIYVHRQLKHVAVNELIVQSEEDLILDLTVNMGSKSSDIDFEVNEDFNKPCTEMKGKVNDMEIEGLENTEVAVVWSNIPNSVAVKKGKTVLRYVTCIVTSLDDVAYLALARDKWREAVRIGDELLITHTEEWRKLFDDRNITIDGNLYLSQVVNAGWFYLLSAVREDCQNGVSPGGLAPSNEYLGHVFWDQDIWMYPPVLLLYPKLAKALLNYRYSRLKEAKDIARKYGFRGAMYPWESAVSGYEVCPQEVYGRNEIHITGDIVFAIKQYYRMTGDRTWLEQKGLEIVFEVAAFWTSRVTYDEKLKTFIILDVMPPDEYQYPVNNSVYTNTVAKLSLEFAVQLGKLFSTKTPAVWQTIAEKMFIPYNDVLNYHPEFEGFDISSPDVNVKQADTILINFPLMYPMPTKVKTNDLQFYENVTDQDGPAMTHSMFAIGWLEVGNEMAAEKAFTRNFANVQEPFKVWSEVRFGQGGTNFITGVGGFLQSLMFGYGGIRIQDEGLSFNLQMVPNTDGFTLNGVKYYDSSIRFKVTASRCCVELLEEGKRTLFLQTTGRKQMLRRERPVYTCKGTITAGFLMAANMRST